MSSTFDPDGPATADDGIYGVGTSEEEATVVYLPVPFEATVSYRTGTADGPRAILDESVQVDLLDVETGRPYEAGLAMRPIPDWIRALSADVRGKGPDVVNAASARVNEHVYESARELIAAKKIVGTVGGDHSIPLGAIRAHAEAYGPLGILHVDAHADLRVAYEGFTWSHASIMNRVLEEAPGIERLVQFGLRDVGEGEVERIDTDERIHAVFDHEIARARLEGRLLDVWSDAVARLPDRVYCSIDIDGLDPKLCPNTGTPVPGGLEFNELSFLLGEVVRQKKTIVGFDLCEVGGAEWDGNVGARVLYKLTGWTLASSRAPAR